VLDRGAVQRKMPLRSGDCAMTNSGRAARATFRLKDNHFRKPAEAVGLEELCCARSCPRPATAPFLSDRWRRRWSFLVSLDHFGHLKEF
jgi:hypothetical protein